MENKYTSQPWYENKLVIILASCFFPPLGIYLIWKFKPFSKNVNTAVSVIGIIIFISAIVTNISKENPSSSNENSTSDLTEVSNKKIDKLPEYGFENIVLTKEIALSGAEDQLKFEVGRDRLRRFYDNSGSKMKDDLLASAKSFTSKFFTDQKNKIENWNGKIKSINTQTNINIEIESVLFENKIIYCINDFKNLELAEKIKNFKVGDAVIFSGFVQPDEDKGIKEKSLTNNGYMSLPEFLVYFVNIQKNEYVADVNPEILIFPSTLQSIASRSKFLFQKGEWNRSVIDVLEGKLIGKDEFEKQDYKKNVLPKLQKDLFGSTFRFNIYGPLKEVETSFTDFKYVFNLDEYNFEKESFNLFISSDELIKLEVYYNINLPENFHLDMDKSENFTIKVPSKVAKEWKQKNLGGLMSLDIFLTFKKQPSQYPNNEYELKGSVVNAVLTNISTREVYWKMR